MDKEEDVENEWLFKILRCLEYIMFHQQNSLVTL